MNTAVKIFVQAPAKLNLTFDVKGALPGGYHEVETLMQAVSLFDCLEFQFSAAKENAIEIICDRKDFPCDDTNLIAKAFRLFLQSLDQKTTLALKVNVEKNIPIAAGLAGGSTNGAATLLAMNEFLDRPLSDAKLNNLAGSLGADLPFCLKGGLAIGRGRGDELEPQANSCPMYFLIVKPRQLALSTAMVYKQYDEFVKTNNKQKKPNLEACANALASGNLESAIKSFGNVFEPMIFSFHPALEKLSQKLAAFGCYTQLTGSGPALFALTDNLAKAELAQKLLEEDDVDSFICQSIKYGAEIAGVKK